MRKILSGSRRNDLALTACNFYNGTAVIFFKLTLTNRDRFNAAVSKGSNTPEQIHIFTFSITIELRRNYQQVYITPSVLMACCLGAENNDVAIPDTRLFKFLEIVFYCLYN